MNLNRFFAIYPNPANSTVNIESCHNENYGLIITDVTGGLFYKTSFSEKVTIPVTGWPAGFYYVQAVSESGYRCVQKLVVE